VSAATTAAATRSLLLAVRLRPMAPAARLAGTLDAMGLDAGDVGVLLGRFERAGLVEERPGPEGPRWRLTDDGRAEGERLLADEVDRLGVRPALTAAYDRFVTLNGPLLRACTAWQLRDADPSALVVNDHTDPVHDRAVIARLRQVDEAVGPVCTDLAVHLGRFSVYGPRFSSAMAGVLAGRHDAFDGPTGDSYHAVWFELHDHLLATLGLDRSLEPLP
jgi:hypothetical protein